jgi:hypothetical protein
MFFSWRPQKSRFYMLEPLWRYQKRHPFSKEPTPPLPSF